MKHTLPVTGAIILIFFLSQVIGLYALNVNTDVVQTPEGETVVEHRDTAIGERPDLEGPQTFVYMVFAILLGTGLILLLVKLGKINVWKMLFFFAVWMTCSITFGVFIDPIFAFPICFALALMKIYKPNVLVHNFTELFIYAGIAIIFVPLLDLFWAVLLLLAISAYDMFAVWRSKHMISLANFQARGKAFAGIMLSYNRKAGGKMKEAGRKAAGAVKGEKPRKGEEEQKSAILGGGDIAFPLIFSGVVMDYLIQSVGLAKPAALLQSMIITAVVAVSLFSILALAEKDRFYPAMPFITAGCLLGFGAVWALNFLA